MVPSFIFGGNTGVASAKELEQQRMLVEALMGRQKPPQNLGEGLSALGEAIGYRMARKRLEKDEGVAKTAGDALYARLPSLFGGQKDIASSEPASYNTDLPEPPVAAPSFADSFMPKIAPQPEPQVASLAPEGGGLDPTQAQPIPVPSANPTPQQPIPQQVAQAAPAQPSDDEIIARFETFFADPAWEHVEPGKRKRAESLYQQLIERRLQASDPLRQLQLQTGKIELENLRNPPPEKGTDDMREYDAAVQQGFKGTLQDWIMEGRKASAQNITVGGGKYGTIPPGFELVETPQGAQLRAIAGGPAAIEAEALKTKSNLATTNKGVSADIVTQDIDRAISSLDDPSSFLPKTGFGAETIKQYGGTGAADLAGLLSSVEANVGFDSLAQMRAASPTGGALGSITERELALLAATKGAITQSQSKEQLKYNLNRLWNVTQDIVHGPNGGPPRRQLGGAQQNAPGAPQVNPSDPLGIRK